MQSPAASSSGGPKPSTSAGGHDRQPSVQLKIEMSGGPPNQQNPRKVMQIVVRNGRYFLSQMSILITKLSPIVQIVSIVVILLYLVQVSGHSAEWLILTPDSVLSVGQWYRVLVSLFTHPFIEKHFYSVIVDIISLSLMTTLIEPLWGQTQVILFFWIVAIGSAMMTCLHYIIIYAITSDVSLLFSMGIHGLSPFCASIAVTVKQMLGQSVLVQTAVGKLKNDDIPLTSLVLAIICYFLHLIEGQTVVMFFYGLIISWLYLRFFQVHEHRGQSQTRGDLSDSFAFHTFFPNVLRPIVAVFADAFYGLLVKVGACPDLSSGQHQTYRLLSERLTSDMNHTNHTSNPRVETL